MLFTLMGRKWRLHARPWYYISITFLVVFVASLTALASTFASTTQGDRTLCVLTLVSALLLVEEEVRYAVLFVLDNSKEILDSQGAPEDVRLAGLWKELYEMEKDRHVELRWTSLGTAIAAACILLSEHESGHIEDGRAPARFELATSCSRAPSLLTRRL